MREHDEDTQPAKGRVQVGDLAPGFTLLNQPGTEVSLKEYLGKTGVVLYFYPRDHTAVCTEEACAFRDSYEIIRAAGAEVIRISSDSVESHRQFAEENRRPFTLVSDTGGAIRARYGAPTAFGLPDRVTYIIDQQGMVRHIFFSQITSKRHIDVALETLQSIREEQMR